MRCGISGNRYDPPEPMVLTCPRCGEILGPEVYLLDGAWLCEACFDDFTADLTRRQLARELNIAVMDVNMMEDELW